jgi:hypothetical protein
MKGICFTFDTFGQWSEHDRSKMKWRMEVGIKWRPSMVGRLKIDGQSATFSLLSCFPPFPSTISLFSSTTTPLGQTFGALATWVGRPATILGWSTTPWLPYKRVAKGSLLLHSTSSQETLNFLNPSLSS